MLKVSMITVDPGMDDWHTSRIYFRYQDSNNHYYFLIKKDGTLELVRFKNSSQTWLLTQPSAYDPEDRLAVWIEAVDDHIKIWVNGNLEIDYTDADPLLGDENIILEGHASYCYFDNVRVEDLDTGEREIWYPSIIDEFSYDANGNLTQITRNNLDTWTFTYDELNRLTETTDANGRTIKYVYDSLGRRTRMTYPDSTQIDYSYDSANRLTGIVDTSTTLVAYTYDNANRRISRTLANGLSTAYTHDAANQITNISSVSATHTVSSYAYTYDDLGNRIDQNDHFGAHDFSYDAMSQLTQADYPDSSSSSFVYDEVYPSPLSRPIFNKNKIK